MPFLAAPPIPYHELLLSISHFRPSLESRGFAHSHRDALAAALQDFAALVTTTIANEHAWRELALVQYHGAGPKRKSAPTFQRALLNNIKSLGWGRGEGKEAWEWQVTTVAEVHKNSDSFRRLAITPFGLSRVALYPDAASDPPFSLSSSSTLHSLPTKHALSLRAQRRYGISQRAFSDMWQ
ncbi:hypothetical protein JCM6882_005344 [Rhodosporidiobolus microsporus]